MLPSCATRAKSPGRRGALGMGLIALTVFLLAGRAAAQPWMGGDQAQQLGGSVHGELGCGACHGEHAPPSAARESCAGCHREAGAEFARGSHAPGRIADARPGPTCVSCHDSHGVRAARDPGSVTAPARAPLLCGSCHARESTRFLDSIHGRTLVLGTAGDAPTCVSCHGRHEASGPTTPRSKVTLDAVADTCGTCHIQALTQFERSVHGSAVGRGVLHAPTCATCHGSHEIQAAGAKRSPTSRLRVAGETCARCHASVKITAMHELPADVVPDFQGSYHGLAGARGDQRVANCASCHGVHDIRPSTDPLSPIFAGNLGRTCGECHPGARERFARGGIHHTTKTWGHWLVDVVGNVYAGMIGMVISLVAFHNALDFLRRWHDRRRLGHAATEERGRPEYLRFTLNERIQHWVLAASFSTLALTGFALRRGWVLPGLSAEWQEPVRATAHRAAAAVFIGLALYHVGYLALTRRGRGQAGAILPRIGSIAGAACCIGACMRMGPPRPGDWRELVATVKYNLGLTVERPRYGRYTYWERLEYWGVVWGGFVMAATGLALWLMVPYLNRFPYWSLELWRTVHLYEATLAVLFIVVSHLYFVVVNPDVFPLNRAMTRGTLTAAEMEREHAQELEGLGDPQGLHGQPRADAGLGHRRDT